MVSEGVTVSLADSLSTRSCSGGVSAPVSTGSWEASGSGASPHTYRVPSSVGVVGLGRSGLST